MPKTISQLQDELLGSNYFDKYAKNKKDFAQIDKLPITKQLTILAAGEFILQVKKNIEKYGLVSTGTLATDIQQAEITETEMGFSLSVGYPANSKAAKYWDYVNKGVKGYESGQPSDTPYTFENYRTKEGAPLIGKKFQKSILQWVRDNSIRAEVDTQNKKLSKVQKKRKAIKKLRDENSNLRSLAYSIAAGIKKKGLKRTNFFDSAVDQYFGKAFLKVISATVGADIQVYTRVFANAVNKK